MTLWNNVLLVVAHVLNPMHSCLTCMVCFRSEPLESFWECTFHKGCSLEFELLEGKFADPPWTFCGSMLRCHRSGIIVELHLVNFFTGYLCNDAR